MSFNKSLAIPGPVWSLSREECRSTCVSLSTDLPGGDGGVLFHMGCSLVFQLSCYHAEPSPNRLVLSQVAQSPDCSDPSFCSAACGSAKPSSISFEVSSEGRGSRALHRAVLMASFHFPGSFLGWDVVVVSAEAWVLLCPRQLSPSVQGHKPVPPSPSLPAPLSGLF